MSASESKHTIKHLLKSQKTVNSQIVNSLAVNLYFLYLKIEQRNMEVKFCPTTDIVADLIRKALPKL